MAQSVFMVMPMTFTMQLRWHSLRLAIHCCSSTSSSCTWRQPTSKACPRSRIICVSLRPFCLSCGSVQGASAAVALVKRLKSVI